MRIKPVLSSKELLDKYHSGIRLYALPDTHRIVSVELLAELLDELETYQGHKMLQQELRALIDKEPTA